MTSRFVDLKEAAEILQVSRPTIERIANDATQYTRMEPVNGTEWKKRVIDLIEAEKRVLVRGQHLLSCECKRCVPVQYRKRSVFLDDQMFEGVKRMAKRRHVSMSEVVRTCIELYLSEV